ncbi:MAG: hypothetical protein DYG89_31800 [Caldilinea sp. CFX5]|nr:hypothetical protein [Caldilinea sp. CFX5]
MDVGGDQQVRCAYRNRNNPRNRNNNVGYRLASTSPNRKSCYERNSPGQKCRRVTARRPRSNEERSRTLSRSGCAGRQAKEERSVRLSVTVGRPSADGLLWLTNTILCRS